jgi:hypothetical protein
MGFMPRNRRVKYFHKFIVEYIEILRASCAGIGGFNYFHKFIVEYIDIVRASCPGIGGLNISISLLWNILI